VNVSKVFFRVRGTPIAQPRHKVAKIGKRVVAYIPKRHPVHKWKAAIAEAAIKQAKNCEWVATKGMPLRVEIVFTFRQAKSNTTECHAQKPDIDNLVKAVFDAMQGIVYHDDAVITELRVRKAWSDCPGVVVEVFR
jgi:Holliday junction resolvase RusA-like endonuclease